MADLRSIISQLFANPSAPPTYPIPEPSGQPDTPWADRRATADLPNPMQAALATYRGMAQAGEDMGRGVWSGLTLPGDVAPGRFDLGRDVAERGILGRVGDLTGLMATGGLGRAATAPVASGGAELGIFGGRLARTADQAALARAEGMTGRGASSDQIWRETGWYQHPVDGQWRHGGARPLEAAAPTPARPAGMAE